MDIVLVAALDEGSVMGADGGIPWYLPEDLRHFKRTTMGHPLVMGRKTYETLPMALPGRHMIVITHQKDYQAPDAQVVTSLEEALRVARAQNTGAAMISGGATIYDQTLPFADRLILTVVHGNFEGDTFFPDFDSEDWKIDSQRHQPADERHAQAMTFVELVPTTDNPRVVRSRKGPGPLPEILRGGADLVEGKMPSGPGEEN